MPSFCLHLMVCFIVQCLLQICTYPPLFTCKRTQHLFSMLVRMSVVGQETFIKHYFTCRSGIAYVTLIKKIHLINSMSDKNVFRSCITCHKKVIQCPCSKMYVGKHKLGIRCADFTSPVARYFKESNYFSLHLYYNLYYIGFDGWPNIFLVVCTTEMYLVCKSIAIGDCIMFFPYIIYIRIMCSLVCVVWVEFCGRRTDWCKELCEVSRQANPCLS